MIINITYFTWCDSHFQGLAKRGESSEQKCNTSVWSEAQTKVKLKILIPMYSKPKLRGIGHLLHNISLFADRLKGSSADDSRIIKNCHCYCWSLYKLSYLMSTIFPKKDQQKWRLKKKNFGMCPRAICFHSLFKWQKNFSRKYFWFWTQCH